jgi:hypothetical protein
MQEQYSRYTFCDYLLAAGAVMMIGSIVILEGLSAMLIFVRFHIPLD